MEKVKIQKYSVLFNRLSGAIINFTGSPAALICALLIVLMWAVAGPVFRFSEAWQITINTGTGIITFLMVFIIQQSQNKDILALHLKLNELIAVNKGASNKLVSAEDLTKEELAILKRFYAELSASSNQEKDLNDSDPLDKGKNARERKEEMRDQNNATNKSKSK